MIAKTTFEGKPQSVTVAGPRHVVEAVIRLLETAELHKVQELDPIVPQAVKHIEHTNQPRDNVWKKQHEARKEKCLDCPSDCVVVQEDMPVGCTHAGWPIVPPEDKEDRWKCCGGRLWLDGKIHQPFAQCPAGHWKEIDARIAELLKAGSTDEKVDVKEQPGAGRHPDDDGGST